MGIDNRSGVGMDEGSGVGIDGVWGVGMGDGARACAP